MFVGETMTDPEGHLIPGISAIRFETFERQGEWTDSLHDGFQQTYWEILGQQDLTSHGLKSGEETPWGSLKALFR